MLSCSSTWLPRLFRGLGRPVTPSTRCCCWPAITLATVVRETCSSRAIRRADWTRPTRRSPPGAAPCAASSGGEGRGLPGLWRFRAFRSGPCMGGARPSVRLPRAVRVLVFSHGRLPSASRPRQGPQNTLLWPVTAKPTESQCRPQVPPALRQKSQEPRSGPQRAAMAAIRAWRSAGTASAPRSARQGRLQWGRGLSTAEMALLIARPGEQGTLQWGRGLSTAEMRTLPSSPASPTARFNGAAVFQPRKS